MVRDNRGEFFEVFFGVGEGGKGVEEFVEFWEVIRYTRWYYCFKVVGFLFYYFVLAYLGWR